ncbi:MAG TPA: hypothetical protein PLV45_15885, partial [bacterium]|nr:hypothetical protein [bacterium]
ILRNGRVTLNFPAYDIAMNSQVFDYGHVMTLPGYPDAMFMLGIEETGPAKSIVASQWDLTSLPAAPGLSNFNSIPIPASTVGILNTAAFGNHVFYVYNYNNELHLNRLDVSSNSWDPVETIIGSAGEELSFPLLAVDDEGFLYLGYQQYSIPGGTWQFVIRRSINPSDIATGFDVEHIINPVPALSFFPHLALAVAGDATTGNLKVAVAYQNPLTVDYDIATSVEFNGNWTDANWTGVYNVINAAPGITTSIQGPDLAFGVNKIRLFAVWLDDRTGQDNIYSAVSFTGGLNWTHDRQLTTGNPVMESVPQVITGHAPGNLAIAYARNNGIGISPYAFVLMATFYDFCDDDPSVNWNTYTGVSPVTTQFHGLTGKSYQLANAVSDGELLRDFGSEPQVGSVDLYFYDDTANTLEDFTIGLDDNSVKGVIRMLGVKNDVTPQGYYAYYDGSQWISWSPDAVRSTGWHHVVMTVTEAEGLVMALEYADGEIVTWSDPTYTGFTSIFVQGGSVSEPYYVDDVQVEVYPRDDASLPATSPVSLILLLGGFYLILSRIRRSRFN